MCSSGGLDLPECLTFEMQEPPKNANVYLAAYLRRQVIKRSSFLRNGESQPKLPNGPPYPEVLGKPRVPNMLHTPSGAQEASNSKRVVVTAVGSAGGITIASRPVLRYTLGVQVG